MARHKAGCWAVPVPGAVTQRLWQSGAGYALHPSLGYGTCPKGPFLSYLRGEASVPPMMLLGTSHGGTRATKHMN